MSLTRKTSKLHRRTHQILDKRPCNVVPVGAWVEVYPKNDVNTYEAVFAAQHEEERLQRLQVEKDAKLAKFRQEVRSRVKELHRLKQQQQLQESFQAVELHGRVMHRTAPSANRLSHRKDACLYQSTDPHAIGHEQGQGSTPGGSYREGGGDATRETVGCLVSEQAGQTRRLVQKAKRDLASKQLVAKPRADPFSVPGGLWGSSFSRDRPATVGDTGVSKLPHDPRSRINDPETSSTHSDQRIPQLPIEGALYGDTTEFSEDRTDNEGDIPSQKHVTFAPGLRGSPQDMRQVKGHGTRDPFGVADVNNELSGGEENIAEPVPCLEISPKRAHMGNYTESRVKGHDELCERFKGHTVPEVNPGVVAEEHKRQQGLQFSMYRRLFMDIEREQVRENMRRKTHHRKIQHLKKTKEQERLEIEKQSQMIMQPSQITGESDAGTRQREAGEAEEIKRIQARLKQKNKETKRFIRALRAMMRERIALLGVNPPPLCACGPTVWDANPETCANNCIFYKNPKAYAKALASVLTLNDTG